MILRIATAIALSCAFSFTAQAQQGPLQPAEKSSPKPLQRPSGQQEQPQSSATPAQPPFAHSP